jgi:hypothetical protein
MANAVDIRGTPLPVRPMGYIMKLWRVLVDASRFHGWDVVRSVDRLSNFYDQSGWLTINARIPMARMGLVWPCLTCADGAQTGDIRMLVHSNVCRGVSDAFRDPPAHKIRFDVHGGLPTRDAKSAQVAQWTMNGHQISCPSRRLINGRIGAMYRCVS